MRFNLDQLESMYWVARLGGFRAAAAHQHVSQPTVTARIRELERILGTELFERTQQRTSLTLAGRDVLEYAEKILRLSERLVSATVRKDALKGVLRLGVNESTAMTCMTELLTYLRHHHADLKVELTVDVGTTLCASLNNRTLDAAIVTEPMTDAHVSDVKLGTAHLEWLAATSLVAPGTVYTAASLTALPIFTIARPSTLFNAAQTWLASEGVDFNDYSTCNSMAAMAQLVASGHAVAILPPVTLEQAIESGKVTVVKTTTHFPAPDFYFSYLRECEGPELQAFIAHARTAMQCSKLLAVPVPQRRRTVSPTSGG